MATILTSNKNGFNAVNFNYGAEIIHQDEKLVILSVDTEVLNKVEPSFWLPEEKLISRVIGEDVGKNFHAKAWTHDCDVGNQSIIKFYADSQDWFEPVNLDLSYEYNEYVVGYVVTDKNTSRSVNFQFKNNGVLDYGLDGDDTYQNFNECDLEAIKNYLRSHNDVDELENNYALAMELELNEDGIHPIVKILANGDGITKQQIIDLAEQANQ
ncbi:hypothetical protein [uncultured Agitococcus sp.]|mgnify:CR=1 FL=1|uniref:hypothetical protein n=1 Tax=uncultured Agitococcus sp. TaxID=1506599 RepID=UPI00260D446C|nr:hypothetical protein [uncultured Agitococcus sp.]